MTSPAGPAASARRFYTLEDVRAIVDPLGLPFVVTRGEQVVWGNAAYERFAGRPLAEFVGVSWPDLLPPPDRARLMDRYQRGASRAPTKPYPVLAHTPGGVAVQALVHASYLPAEDGPPFIVAVLVELTESTRVHQMLADLGAVSAAILAERTEQGVRRAVVDGLRAAHLAASFQPADRLDAAARHELPDPEAAREALTTGVPIFAGAETPMPTRAYVPLDEPRELLVLQGPLTPLHTSHLALFARSISAALANCRLIADLERVGAQSKRRLAQTQELLELARTTAATLELDELLDSACDAMVRLLDVSNVFVLLLEGQALVGVAASAGHRAAVRDIRLPLDGPSAAARAVREARPIAYPDLSAPALEVNMTLVHRFGEKSLLAIPLTSRHAPLGAVVMDDTRAPREFSAEELEQAQASAAQIALSVANARLYRSLKDSYLELEATRAEGVRRERLAALGELAAVVAHEVRNPLGVIFNAVNALRRFGADAPDAPTLLEIVSEECERLNRMVGDMLDFARPRQMLKGPVDLGALVAEAVEAARATHVGDGVRVDVRLEGALPPVELDRELFRQALVNVVQNALQALPRGGAVTVRAGPDAPAGWIFVSVEDDGQGMTPEVASRLFEPFFTTRARGTGLGLPVVKRIVEDHGGEVVVRSASGRGTTFTVRIPGGAR